MNTSRRVRRRLVVGAATVAAACCAGAAVVLVGTAGAATTPEGAQSPPAHTALGPSASKDSAPTPGSAHSSVPSTAPAPPSTAAVSPHSSIGSTPLAASRMPDFTGQRWQTGGPLSSRTVTGQQIPENECAKVDGATTWTQQGYIGGDGQNPATEDTFDFTDAAAARSAYQTFTAAMANCQETTRALQSSNKVAADAVVRQTAALPQALAWERTWTGVMGMSAAGPQTNHTYAAVAGSRLIVLQFTEFPGDAAPYALSGDPQILAMLSAEVEKQA